MFPWCLVAALLPPSTLQSLELYCCEALLDEKKVNVWSTSCNVALPCGLAQDITRDCKAEDVDITCSHIFLLRNSGLDVHSATNASSVTQVGASCACLNSQGNLATVPRVWEKMRMYYNYFLPYENPWVHLLCLQHLQQSGYSLCLAVTLPFLAVQQLRMEPQTGCSHWTLDVEPILLVTASCLCFVSCFRPDMNRQWSSDGPEHQTGVHCQSGGKSLPTVSGRCEGYHLGKTSFSPSSSLFCSTHPLSPYLFLSLSSS